jgi:hypothetical protein
MICNQCKLDKPDIIVFNNVDTDTKVCICKSCLDGKVDKGKLTYEVEKNIYKSRYKNL